LADSGALRVRRARAHAAGDHSLCRRCVVVRGEGGKGTVAALPSLPADEPAPRLDARQEMEALARRLITAHEGDQSNTLLARELRMTLVTLLPKDAGSADADLTGLFASLQA